MKFLMLIVSFQGSEGTCAVGFCPVAFCQLSGNHCTHWSLCSYFVEYESEFVVSSMYLTSYYRTN